MMKEKVQDNQSPKDAKFSESNKPENTNYNMNNKQSDTQLKEVNIFDFDDKEFALEEALNELDYWTFYT